MSSGRPAVTDLHQQWGWQISGEVVITLLVWISEGGSMFRCMFRWTHRYSWPQNGVQTCVHCGCTRKAALALAVSPRLDVPRWTPRVTEGE